MSAPILAVLGLSKRLNGRPVLEQVNLLCNPSDVCFVIGANGSGKSTLLRLLAGILEPDAGEISIAGRSLRKDPVSARAALGYAPDGAAEALPDLLASEFVTLVRALGGLPVALSADEARWHERLGIAPFWHRRLHALSFGQQKRVLLAAALAGDPALLLLDEPSNGLDPAAQDSVAELIAERRSRGRGHVIATNDPAFVEKVGGMRFSLVSGRLSPMDAEKPAN